MASAALMKQGEKRRKQIVKYVDWYIRKNGHSPSIDEIAVKVGLSSKASVRHHITRLVEEGELVQDPRVHRSLRLPA